MNLPLHHDWQAVAAAIGLFCCGLISPGPNFLVVVQSTVAGGRRAGLATGLGAATGDGVYALAGICGASALIAECGQLFGWLKLAGSLVLIWMGMRMMKGRSDFATARRDSEDARGLSGGRSGGMRRESLAVRHYYWRGLITDLANPKTILFFAGIFSVTLSDATPFWVRAMMPVGIVLTSLLWRSALACLFAIDRLRHLYERAGATVERCCGGLLVLLGIKLASDSLRS